MSHQDFDAQFAEMMHNEYQRTRAARLAANAVFSRKTQEDPEPEPDHYGDRALGVIVPAMIVVATLIILMTIA